MASETLRSIGTRASCHRRNRRGTRFRETEYEIGHRASPIREASEDSKSSDAFFFWKFGRPLVPSFPATARPGSGKAPANTRRYRLRKVSSLRTRTVFRFRNENTAGRKNGRARRPPRSGCGRPLYFTASQSCRCNGRNIAETSRSTSETRSFFFRFQALCRLLRIISTSVRISRSGPNRPSSPPSPCKTLDYDGRSATENPTRQDSRSERLTILPPDVLRQLRIISASIRASRPAPGRPSSLHRPARPMIMSDKARRETRRNKIRDRSV